MGVVVVWVLMIVDFACFVCYVAVDVLLGLIGDFG